MVLHFLGNLDIGPYTAVLMKQTACRGPMNSKAPMEIPVYAADAVVERLLH